ncbi:uncharacterized protein LOC119744358 [Patiria miniata]|uniref:EMI domain-containing protein n=1 Tax=Patiria miniata TaxID=46514 RepID=A0A914BIQ4_PATMI|nr:uncharacterized protein LOC119744358 [Patiria miniata]
MNFWRYTGRLVRFFWMIGFVLSVVIVVLGRGVSAARPKGNNVCTRVKRFTEVYRISIPGTRTQTVRYTTICGIQGRCSRYRIVYVQNYREETRTIYRVVQECCAGWVQKGRRCVTRPSTDTAAGTVTTPVPTVTVTAGTKNEGNLDPRRPFVTGLSGTTERGAIGTDAGVVGAGGGETGGGKRRGWDGVPTEGGLGEGIGSNKGGRGVDIGRDGITGGQDADGSSNTKNGEGVLQDGAIGHFPEEVEPATPDVQPPQKDSGMMFLTGMLCGVGVLSVAAFVVLFLMYRQRRSMDGRLFGLPFLQSSRFGSTGSFRKSKLLALAQSIKSGEVKLIRESTKKGNGDAQCPYTDIVEMQRVITSDNSTKSLPALSSKQTDNKQPSLKLSKTMTLKKSTSSRPPIQNERQLPPEPPTYAIIQRMEMTKETPEASGSEDKTPRCSAEFRYSTLYATPDAALTGNSHTIPRDFNMGPPRYILCESQHIYADIQRKSKASTWSCSKKSRPKSTASAGDTPRRSRRTLGRSLSRNSLHSIAKRSSNSGSSGYSSLRGSRENIFDNYESVEERSDPPTPNIYSETIPKDIGTTEHYDRLDLIASDSLKTEYDKLNRGPKTSRGAGIVKTFSKKYEKLAADMSKR